MKKRKNTQGKDCIPNQNPVAKFAHLFNKAQTFCDKSKYSRKAKHTRQEASPMVPGGIIGLAPCFTLNKISGLFFARQTHPCYSW